MSPGTTRNLHALGFCILANKSRRRANGESTSESPGWCLVGGGGGGGAFWWWHSTGCMDPSTTFRWMHSSLYLLQVRSCKHVLASYTSNYKHTIQQKLFKSSLQTALRTAGHIHTLPSYVRI